MPTEAPPKQCAHEPCTCDVWKDNATERDGRLYCCENCAEGKPCGHDGCECNK